MQISALRCEIFQTEVIPDHYLQRIEPTLTGNMLERVSAYGTEETIPCKQRCLNAERAE
jgi:hypothetical protein